MDRRRFLLTSLAGAVAEPLGAGAQQAGRVRTVGFLSPGYTPTPEQTARSPFRAKLRELGWIVGQNLAIERAYGEGRIDRLPELAAELVRKRVDVIAAHATDAAVAAARATKTIPIVFFDTGLPVELGLVDSLARPGRNVTGSTSYAGIEQFAKLLEFLKQLAPGATRLAWIATPTKDPTVAGGERSPLTDIIEPAARQLGFEMGRHVVYELTDLEAAFGAIVTSRAQAIGLAGNLLTWLERRRIVDFANRNRLASSFSYRSYIEAGGLVSYGSFEGQGPRQGAAYIDRILRGARPADLPVEHPTKFELVINVKTAKALGLTIPPSLLARADQVIE